MKEFKLSLDVSLSDFTLDKILGSGIISLIYNKTREKYAIKFISSPSDYDIKRIRNLNNPNLLKIYSSINNEDNFGIFYGVCS